MDGVPYELVAPPIVLGPLPPGLRPRRGVYAGLADPETGERVLLGVGGGRVMVAAAERAAATSLPWLAVPTTYAPACLTVSPPPVRVLADPALAATLPGPVRRRSLAAARAVSIEALWAPDGSPSVRWVALSAVRVLHQLLRPEGRRGEPSDPGRDALRAALLAAVGAANCAPGLLSVLAQRLGRYGVPWALAMAALLPRMAAWQAPAVGDALATLADVAGAPSTQAALAALAEEPLPRLDVAVVDAVTADLATATYVSPRAATAADLRTLLTA